MMHEKSFILVLIFEILLVTSSAFLAVGYDVLTSAENSQLFSRTKNVIYVGVVTENVREFALPLQQSGITYFYYSGLTEAEQAFTAGYLDALIVGNLNLRPHPSVLTVYLPQNSPKVGLTRLLLKRFFSRIEGELRDVKMQIYTPKLELYNTREVGGSKTSSNFEVFMVFTLPILFFMPSVMGASLVIDSLTEEIESKRILNLLTAPISNRGIILGKCLGSLSVTLPHTIIWLILLTFTDFPPQNKIGILLFSTLYSLFFIFTGASCALYYRNNRQAQMASTVLAVATIMLFSPNANASESLIHFSPSYIFTNLALGMSCLSLYWQLAIAGFFVFFSYILCESLLNRLDRM